MLNLLLPGTSISGSDRFNLSVNPMPSEEI